MRPQGQREGLTHARPSLHLTLLGPSLPSPGVALLRKQDMSRLSSQQPAVAHMQEFCMHRP